MTESPSPTPPSSNGNPPHDESAEVSQVDQSREEQDGCDGQPENASAGSALPFSKARSIALVATVTGAAFVNTLAAQSTVIILPTIGRALDVPGSRLQWIVSSYNLTFGCFLLLWGRIGDIYGKKTIFVAGSIWVTIVLAVNPLMPNEIAFDVFRGLHGLGAAANVPTAIGILGVTFPPGKAKNYAFSAYSAGAPLGSVFGNIIAGLIAQYANWKWVFGALAIMAGVISVAGIALIPPPPPPPSEAVAATIKKTDEKSQRRPAAAARQGIAKAASVDWLGAALITGGLMALQLALTEGNVVGWSTAWIAALIVVAVAVIACFAAWQWYLESRTSRPPIVKVSLFANGRFSAVMLAVFFFFASFNNFLVFATYFYQDYQGLDPIQTALRFVPTGVSGLVVIVIVSQLLSRVPTLFILVGGNVAVSLASLLFAAPIPPSTSYFAYGFLAMILSVVGADSTWPSLMLFMSSSMPREDQAVAGALVNAVGQAGRAIGLALSTAVQTAVMASARGRTVEDSGAVAVGDGPSLDGLRAASWTNFAFGLTSLVVVIFAFRSLEIIGKVAKADLLPEPVSGEEGIMSQDDPERPAVAADDEDTVVGGDGGGGGRSFSS